MWFPVTLSPIKYWCRLLFPPNCPIPKWLWHMLAPAQGIHSSWQGWWRLLHQRRATIHFLWSLKIPRSGLFQFRTYAPGGSWCMSLRNYLCLQCPSNIEWLEMKGNLWRLKKCRNLWLTRLKSIRLSITLQQTLGHTMWTARRWLGIWWTRQNKPSIIAT